MATLMCKLTTLTGLYLQRAFKSDIFFKIVAVHSRAYSLPTSNKDEKENANIFANIEEVIDQELEEEKIEQFRDISGLTPAQKRRVHGELPEINNEYKQSIRYQRRLYGKFGKESGLEPNILWPTKQEAVELAQLNHEWEPSLEERIAKMNMQKQMQAKKMLEREKRIEQNMAKMNQWIQEYRNRVAKKEAEVQAREKKKRLMLEEAREYFGYAVDPRDAKFQEMVEEKEKQEKILAKKHKKEKQLERFTAKLKALTEDTDKKEEKS